jgi:hypothetical protein
MVFGAQKSDKAPSLITNIFLQMGQKVKEIEYFMLI